jgi:hypothetical protein
MEESSFSASAQCVVRLLLLCVCFSEMWNGLATLGSTIRDKWSSFFIPSSHDSLKKSRNCLLFTEINFIRAAAAYTESSERDLNWPMCATKSGAPAKIEQTTPPHMHGRQKIARRESEREKDLARRSAA